MKHATSGRWLKKEIKKSHSDRRMEMGLAAHIVYGMGLRKWCNDQRNLVITKRQNKEGLARNEIGLASSESCQRLYD
jgi:hypothetical protein